MSETSLQGDGADPPTGRAAWRRRLTLAALVIAAFGVVALYGVWRRAEPRRRALDYLLSIDRHDCPLHAEAILISPARAAWWERPVCRLIGSDRFLRWLGPWATFDSGWLSSGRSDPECYDRVAEAMAHFPEIRQIHLHGQDGKLTDRGCAALARIDSLVDLDMSSTEITDKGLAQLGRLRHLKYLTIEFTPSVTGEGFREWPVCPSLLSLRVDDTGFNDEGLRQAGRCFPNLERLCIYSTRTFQTRDWKILTDPVFPKLKSIDGAASNSAARRFLSNQPSLEWVFGEKYARPAPTPTDPN